MINDIIFQYIPVYYLTLPPQPLINLDEDPSNINDYVSLLFVRGEGMDEGAAKAMMDKMSSSGEQYIQKARTSKEDQEFMFFFSNSAVSFQN